MIKFIRYLLIGIGMGTVLIMGVKCTRTKSESKDFKSDFTHEELDKINPDLVVDYFTLVDSDSYKATKSEFIGRLLYKKIVLNTPIGLIYNPIMKMNPYQMSVVIQSGGGLVGAGKDLIVFLNGLREAGVKVNCYVSEAQSMAFTLVVLGCDKVIAKKNVILMEHRVSFEGSDYTPGTFMEDNNLSKLEAAKIGVNWHDWLNLARGEKMHIFTKEEIKKYKLVDEWMD